MSATLVTPKTASGGEIIRELINSSDGQGLHFNGVAGGVNLGSSMPDLGTKYSLEFVVKGDSKTGEVYLLDAFKSGARIIFAWSGSSSGKIQLHINGTWSSAFMATPENGEVVHLILSVDGTSATLYKNGNAESTQTVVANTMASATSTHIGCSQNGTGNFFNGSAYRTRFYNSALTQAEVNNAYQRADVDFDEQYGSQTNLVNPAANGDFSGAGNWVGQGNHAVSIVSNELKVVASGASTSSSNAATLVATYGGTDTNGKVYTWTFTARASSGTPTLRARTPFDHSDVTTGSYKDFVLSTSNQTFSITGKRIALENGYFGLLEAGTFFIDNIKATQIGAVADYDLAFANPTQSLMVQDRAGVADGTSSATGVSQTQKIPQLNAVAARIGTSAATPADGALMVQGDGTFGDGTGNAKVNIDGDSAAAKGAYVSLKKDGSQTGAVGHRSSILGGTSSNLMMYTATGAIDFYNGGTRMSIDSAGAIGLARTANTGYRLDVLGQSGYEDVVLIEGNGTNMGPRINLTPTGTGVSRINATANSLALQTGGAERLTITSAGLVTVKNAIALDTNTTPDTSGGQGFLYKHASNGTSLSGYNCSIETGSAGSRAAKLTVSNTGNVTQAGGIFQKTGTNGNFTIDAAGQTIDLSRNGGNYLFANGGSSASLQIQGQHSLQFSTGASQTERMRINSAGNVSLEGSNDVKLTLSDQGTPHTNDSNFIRGRGATGLQFNSAVGGYAFEIAGTEKVGISAAGLATFANGISLGNETLSDYDVGTFTPTLSKGSTAIASPNSASGRYVRVGKLLYVELYFFKNPYDGTGSSGTDNWFFGGLPFSVVEDLAYQSISLNYFSMNGVNYFNLTPHRWQANDTTKLTLYGQQNITNWSSSLIEIAASGTLELA